MQRTPSSNRIRIGRFAVLGATAALIAAAIALTTPFARAATISVNPLEPALGFNAFVENDTTLDSEESEGPIATGGDLILGGPYNVMIHDTGTFTVDGDAQPSALVVGGRVAFTDSDSSGLARVLNDGYVKVGDLAGTDVLNTDSNNAQVNTRLVATGAGYDSSPRIELNTQQPAASVGPVSPIDFDAAFATFRSDADQLALCPATVAMTDPSGAVVDKGEVEPGQPIRITLEEGRTNVLNVTGDDLNNMANLTFLDPPTATAPLLVNVDTSGTGGVFDWDVASQAGIGGGQAPYMLWNFGTGTTGLTVASGDTVEGSIFAPNAEYLDITPTNVEGQIVAKQASLGAPGQSGGEIHHFPFAATLTCETGPGPGPTIPDQPTTTADVSPSDSTTTADVCPSGSTGPAPSYTGRYSNGTDGRGGSLATTGTALLSLLVAAGALLALGAAAVLAAIRRRGDAQA